jgi:hypothetical protein
MITQIANINDHVTLYLRLHLNTNHIKYLYCYIYQFMQLILNSANVEIYNKSATI